MLNSPWNSKWTCKINRKWINRIFDYTLSILFGYFTWNYVFIFFVFEIQVINTYIHCGFVVYNFFCSRHCAVYIWGLCVVVVVFFINSRFADFPRILHYKSLHYIKQLHTNTRAHETLCHLINSLFCYKFSLANEVAANK